MSSFQCSSASTAQQSPQTNPFTAIKAINRSELTKGAKVLYAQLRVSAGPKGYVFYRVSRLAEDTRSSISSTKEYLQELRSVGLVIPEYRPGHSNKWFVLDPDPTWDGKVHEGVTPPTQPEDQREGSQDFDGGVADGPAPLKNVFKTYIKKRCTFLLPPPKPRTRSSTVPDPENENVIVSDHFKPQDPSPDLQPDPAPNINTNVPTHTSTPQRVSNPDTPIEPKHYKIFNVQLLTEILDLTGDIKSRDCWISVINQIPEERIRYALSCFRITLNEGTILDRPGGYLLAIVMNNNPNLRFRGRKYQSPQTQVSDYSERDQPQTYDSPDLPPQPKTPRFCEPEPDIPEPLNTEALIKGWMLSYKSGGVNSLLTWVDRCVPDTLDAKKLWADVRSALPEGDESFLVDRFLDTVATRMKHAESLSEG